MSCSDSSNSGLDLDIDIFTNIILLYKKKPIGKAVLHKGFLDIYVKDIKIFEKLLDQALIQKKKELIPELKIQVYNKKYIPILEKRGFKIKNLGNKNIDLNSPTILIKN